MGDYSKDFISHHDNAGKAFKSGDRKGAASNLGRALRSLKSSENKDGMNAGKTVTVTQADNPQPVGDEAPPPDQRGFGPGRQFGRGRGRPGTPKPTPTKQGAPQSAASSLRGRLKGIAARGR